MDKRKLDTRYTQSQICWEEKLNPKKAAWNREVTPIQIWIIRYLYENSEKVVFQKDIEKFYHNQVHGYGNPKRNGEKRADFQDECS